MSVAVADQATPPGVDFLWLEITGRCQLACGHCYADSSPQGSHGAMTAADWKAVIDSAAEVGVDMVQFIGGEPTLHPDLPGLVAYALAAGLTAEVFTNLLHVSERMWEVFAQPGVRLATSYYASDPARHDEVTGRAGSHSRTRANIAEAVRRGIPLRVGLLADTGGDVEAARAELESLGVANIRVDQVRAVGRGGVGGTASTCGRCGHGRAAVRADGAVTPCVFTRGMVTGNVLTDSLGKILADPRWRATVGTLTRPGNSFSACNPEKDSPPCVPTHPEPVPNR